MSLRWYFRVSSTPEVGGGHMSRCLSLAKSLVQIETTVVPVFVLDRGGEDWLGQVQDAGFEAVFEDNEPAGPWAGVLVDSYHFNDEDVVYFKTLAEPLVVIDDFSHPHKAANLVINSGCHLDGDTLAGRPALLGPRYALLGVEYRDIPARPARESVRNVLISFGRIDSKNVTGLALDALATLFNTGQNFATEVVLGKFAPHRADIAKMISQFPGPVELCIDIDDMPVRLAKAELAIGGGGVSLLERMAAGLASVTVVQAKNQSLSAESAVRHGATLNVGAVENLTSKELAAQVGLLMSARDMREDMSRAGQAWVDGYGSTRVAKAMLGLGSVC